jgi:hypothetical protein
LKWLTVLLGRKVADESPVLVLLLLVLHPLLVLLLVLVLHPLRVLVVPVPVPVPTLLQVPPQAGLTWLNSVRHKRLWQN